MNKLIVPIFLTVLILIGGITSIFYFQNQQEKNMPFKISVKANSFEKTEYFDPENMWFDVIAKANHPISNISIQKKNEDVVGWIDLDTTNKTVHFQRLEVNDLDFWQIYPLSQHEHENHSPYQLQTIGNIQRLSMSWQDIPLYFQNTSGNHQDVLMSGNMSFDIPTHWAVFMSERFPKLAVEGQLILNGKSYQLENINSPSLIDQPYDVIKNNPKTDYLFTFTHQNESLTLGYQQTSARDLQKFHISNQGELYEFDYRAHHKDVWQETPTEISININPVTLKGKHEGQEAKLSIHLKIPKNRVDMTANGHSMLLLGGNSNISETRNNERSYELTFAIANNEILILSITQIGKGVYNIHYYDETTEQRCGDDTQSCFGLSVASDQKTFQFNQVKVGKYTLNGQLYIAGVL